MHKTTLELCDELHVAVERLDCGGFIETNKVEISIEGTQIKIAEVRLAKGALYIWPMNINQERVYMRDGARITNVLFD